MKGILQRTKNLQSLLRVSGPCSRTGKIPGTFFFRFDRDHIPGSDGRAAACPHRFLTYFEGDCTMEEHFQDLPAPQGLYDPANEHDACGIGFIVNIKGERSYDIVSDALDILENLKHSQVQICV